MPVVDQIAADYQGEVVFLGVAGRSSFQATAERAGQWFSERIIWGLDDSIWDLYGVPYQPVTFLITGDDVVVDGWPGALPEEEIRSRLDRLLELSA